MLVRFYGSLFLALLAIRPGCTAATTLPSVEASPGPCASSTSDPSDVTAAFAYDLESPDVLRFIRVLVAVPERDQKRIFDAAIAAGKVKPEQDVQTAIESLCVSPGAVDGAFRATSVVVNDWKLRDLKDAPRFVAFDAVLATAVSALSLGDSLTTEQRLTATQPFIGFDLQAPAHPLPTTSRSCTDMHARPIILARPAYPSDAVAAGSTGQVNVVVRLSDTGDVRSARIARDTVGNAIGGDELRLGAIFAAATTTYAPEVRNCVPTAGAYMFQADFSAR